MGKHIKAGNNTEQPLHYRKFDRGGYVVNRFGIVKNKPIGWYYRKLMCEIGWKYRNAHILFWHMYYKNLHEMVRRYSINLYGEKI